jgi:hypothetical protein
MATVTAKGHISHGGINRNAKRRSHPLRYERQFSPKASPVTEGLKFMVLARALAMDQRENLGRSFVHRAAFFVIRMFGICKNWYAPG